jgi:hypothetical protein
VSSFSFSRQVSLQVVDAPDRSFEAFRRIHHASPNVPVHDD